MLVGSVLVTCRCLLAVVRVLGPVDSGAPSGLFSVDFGRAKRLLRGRGVFVGLEVYGAL